MGDRYDVIVVGGGIAGGAAALRAAQYNHMRVCWLLGDRDTRRRSRSQWVANIDNMIGIHDGVMRGKLARSLPGAEMKEARDALRAGHHEHISTRDIVRNTIERVEADYADQVEMIGEAAVSADRTDDGFEVATAEETFRASWVVLATGVMDRQPSIRRASGDKVIDEPQWIYPFANRETVLYCIRCEGHLTPDTPTAVLGHSETAAQIAMMLHERYGSVCSILTNGESPSWSGSSGRVLETYGIAVRQERLIDVTGPKGDLHGFVLDGGGPVDVRFALVALGLHRVYNDLAVQLGADLADPDKPEPERHVLVNARGETSVSHLFAVGDMATRSDETIMKQVYTSQEYAVRAIDAIDARIRKAKRRASINRGGDPSSDRSPP